MPWFGSKAARSVDTEGDLLEVSEVHPEVASFLAAVFGSGKELDNMLLRLSRTQVPDSFERGDQWKINMFLDPTILTDDILRAEPMALSQLRVRKLRSAATRLARKAPQLLDQVHELATPSLLNNVLLAKAQSSPDVFARLPLEREISDFTLLSEESAISATSATTSPMEDGQNFEVKPPKRNVQLKQRSLSGIGSEDTPGLNTAVSFDFDRLKMVALYEAHNPTKVGEVDELLLKYTGKHEAMFAKLGKKYGSKALAAAEKRVRQDEHEIEENRVVKGKDKAHMKPKPPIDSEATIMAKQIAPPTTPHTLRYAKTAPNLRAVVMSDFDRLKMIALYEAHNPTKVGEVDGLLLKYEGKHAAMFAKLEQKYGSEALAAAEHAAMLASKKECRKVKPPPIQVDIAVKDQIPLPLSPFSATFSFKTDSPEKQLRSVPSFRRAQSLPFPDAMTGLTVAWKVFAKAGPEGDEVNFETIRIAEESKREEDKAISTKLNASWQMDTSSTVELKKLTQYYAREELALNRAMTKMKNESFKEAREAFMLEEKALEKAAEEAYEKYVGNSVENTAAAERHRMKRQKQLDQQHKAEKANEE